MNRDYDDVLANMTTEDIEELLYKYDIEFERVEPGKGGFVIKDDFDKDCICRKGEQDVGIHESIYYSQDKKSWVLSLETDRYYELGCEQTEIKYCPHCGRKLGDE